MMFFADKDVDIDVPAPVVQSIVASDITTQVVTSLAIATLVLISANGNEYKYPLNSPLPAGLTCVPDGTGLSFSVGINRVVFFTTVPFPAFAPGTWTAYIFYDPTQSGTPSALGKSEISTFQWGGNVADVIQRTSRYLLNRIEPDSLVNPTALNVYDDAGVAVIETRTIANASGNVNPEQVLRLGTLTP